MAAVFLGLGSNIGSREGNIRRALNILARHPKIRISRISSLYETAPIGYTDQPDFINAVVSIETDLPPEQLLDTILQIEKEMGRVRDIHWGPRIIDIDILIYDEKSINTHQLVIPHPRMIERKFVMAPLAEIAPNLRLHNGKTPGEMMADLNNQHVRRLVENQDAVV